LSVFRQFFVVFIEQFVVQPARRRKLASVAAVRYFLVDYERARGLL
jgi:hypothetical protein